MSERRRAAIRRRRIFITSAVLIFALIVGIISFAVVKIAKNISASGEKNTTSTVSNTTSSKSKKEDTNEKNDTGKNTDSFISQIKDGNLVGNAPDINEKGLDANYTNLMLINASNPLPDNYDSEIRADLVEIDPQYRNNNYVTKIHKSVYPYITAMVKAAQADGVGLKVWSPFRSYADQNVLFQNQVARVGGDEAKAATVVARPGTSEHNSGICADFNMASDAFEQTEMFKWMCEHAEEYGFILRYPKNKQDKTGVIYESWHWRFVGIKMAKEINKSGLCLEEYLEKYNLSQKVAIDNF